MTIDVFQRDFLKYLRQVKAGAAFVIVEADRAIAELKPISAGSKPLRPFGLCAGDFTVPEDFDAPLTDDILSSFAGLSRADGNPQTL